jgi:hypothetical protein
MTEHSWSDLEKPQAQPPVNDRFNEVCALVFSSGAGKELLGLLRTKYFDAPMNQLADERALRLRINQQQFVRELETACERGTVALANRKPKAV